MCTVSSTNSIISSGKLVSFWYNGPKVKTTRSSAATIVALKSTEFSFAYSYTFNSSSKDLATIFLKSHRYFNPVELCWISICVTKHTKSKYLTDQTDRKNT
ncbi:hypothetical protein Hanom_Chr08g00685271 [Helianthus anomalus]